MIHLRFEQLSFSDAGGQAKVREVRRRFKSRQRILEQQRHVLVEEETERLLELLRQEAPKKTELFAEGLRSNISAPAPGFGFSSASVRASGEHGFLLPFIVLGTRAHEIPTEGSAAQLAKGYPLSFYWEKGPRGPGWYHFWSVQHPGTKPNDFIQRAIDQWDPSAADALRELGAKVVYMKTGP